MIWVGSNGSSESNEVWKPETSIPQELNFDLIISNIQNLNTIAGEGCAQVVHTPNRAELKVCEINKGFDGKIKNRFQILFH